jgi:hypothetical protein
MTNQDFTTTLSVGKTPDEVLTPSTTFVDGGRNKSTGRPTPLGLRSRMATKMCIGPR